MIHSSEYKNRNILIIGGLGFIGSNLAHRLVEIGANVTLLDSMNPNYGGNLANISGLESLVKVNFSDIRDIYSLPIILKNKEVIFNLAGQTSHMDSMTDPVTDLEINSRAQLTFLEALRLQKSPAKVVFASTRQIYGTPQYLPVDEVHPINPVDVNGINKFAGESYHLLYNRVYGIKATVLRLTNVYGPRMRVKDARQTFLGVWIKNLLDGATIEVWGGSQKRDYLCVSDVVDALLFCGLSEDTPGNVYNLGGNEVLTLIETAEILRSIQPNCSIVIKEFPSDRKKIDIGDFYTNFDKFKAVSGWNPQVSFDQGISSAIDFYRENQACYF